MADETAPVPPKRKPSLRWRILRGLVLVFLGLLIIGAIAIYLGGYSLAKAWVESPAGQRTASQGVAKLIKVDGEFSPIHVDGWNLQIDSYQGNGWPGEAIGSMDLSDMHFRLNPGAFWRGAYRIDGIDIAQGKITLLKPNDALKRPTPPKGQRPWYAFLLPSRFECGPIICPHTELEFPFQNGVGRITDARVQADLIGKDLRYTATSGTLEFPYLPPLHIDNLQMMVTRPLITVSDARLSSVDPQDPARLTIEGSIGQREDKAVDMKVEIVAMPIEQVLPAELSTMIHGRATGKIHWQRDTTGAQITSEGEVSLAGASIDDISIFKQLALLHDNPDLQNFTFDQLELKFHRENGVFTGDLTASCANKFSLHGTISYEFATKLATVDLNFGDLPLKTWMPPEFKPRYSGVASARLQWHGSLNTLEGAVGEVHLDLDGTRISNPVILRRILTPKGVRAPDEIFFKTAQLDIRYEDKNFNLTSAQFDLPGLLTATITGSLTAPDNILDANIQWQGLALENCLPEKIASQLSGNLNGHVEMHAKQWKMGDGSYAGHMDLVSGKLRDTSTQYLVARFLNSRELFDISINQASFSWRWSQAGLAVSDLNLRGDDALGLKGNFAVDPDKAVSGTLLIGVKPSYLNSLYGLGDNVFKRRENGLLWADVHLSGTLKQPKQDLGTQLLAQLPSHPGAIVPLAGKMASWYVGNLFGAQEDWRPPTRTVTVSAK